MGDRYSNVLLYPSPATGGLLSPVPILPDVIHFLLLVTLLLLAAGGHTVSDFVTSVRGLHAPFAHLPWLGGSRA